MNVEIDIIDTDGELVATATWSGRTMQDPGGKWKYLPKRATRLDQLKEMLASRDDLRAADFRSVSGDGWVKGFEALEGNLGALRLIVPTLGMSIGSPRVLP